MIDSRYNTGVVNRKVGRSDAGNILRPEQVLAGELTVSHSTSDAPCVKICTKCQQSKPATTEYFSPGKTYRGGLRAICKECRVKATAQYRIANPNQRKEYRRANRDRINAKVRKYNAANREHVNKRQRANYAANRQWRLSQRREYEKVNQAYIAHRNRNYWRANPERMKAKNARRVARERNAPGHHTAADIRQQYKAQKGKCYYCDAKVGDSYHVDHVVPLSRGGSNGPENIVIACVTCNSSKNNRLPHEWPEGGRLL